MDTMIRAYQEAVEELGKLDAREHDTKESIQKDLREIKYDIYRPRIQELENERDDMIRRKEEEGKTLQALIDLDKSRYAVAMQAMKRRIRLMRLAEEGTKDLEVKAYTYDRIKIGTEKVAMDYDPIDVICDDDYKQVHVYIVSNTNTKPKNRYSLIVIGKGAFYGDGLVKTFGHGYINSLHYYGDFLITLREGPDTDKLLTWYKAHGIPAVLQEFLTQHTEMETEFKVVKGLLKDEAWLKLYLEDRRDYYVDRVSNGTSTEEYRIIMERLEALDQTSLAA